MSLLKVYEQFIESHKGRDQMMRLICYSARLIGGLIPSGSLATKFNILSDKFSSCRVVHRLFDDIPMLNYTMSYGLGTEETDKFERFCCVAANVIDQLYYPLEHTAWAADNNLLKIQSRPWWTASTVCWVLSLSMKLLKSLRCLINLHRWARQMSTDVNGFLPRLYFESYNVAVNLVVQWCNTISYSCDLIQAIHCLPAGTLWAGKLKQWHTGLLGLISTLINLFSQAFIKSVSGN